MSKAKKNPTVARQLDQSGIRNQVVLSLLGTAVGAGSRNDRLPKGVRKTLTSLRSTIADAEKKAKKDAGKRRARKARRELVSQLQAGAKGRAKAAAKGAGTKTAKGAAKGAGKATKVTGKATKATAKKTAPVLAARTATKAVKAERGRKRRRSAR